MYLYDFFGLNISIFTELELRETIINNVTNSDKKIYFGYSLGYFTFIKKFPILYSCANNYDIMVTDGRLFYLFARFFGAPIKFDISIPFLSKMIMEIANERGFSMMIVGSNEEINKKATENVREKYSKAKVYDGYTGGDFSEIEQQKTLKIINTYSPDILFLGVSSPKKEIFATNFKSKLNVKIIVPFGGVIDGLAGKVYLSSKLLKKSGLATPIRVIQEPKRLFLINIKSLYHVLFKLIPLSFLKIQFLRDKSFFIPSIYGIKKK